MHRTRQPLQFFLCMAMSMIAICHIVVVIMGMHHCVSMGCSIMGVRERMLMLMSMMPDQRVSNSQNRPDNHHR